MEAMGMHKDDVQLIRNAHEGAWLVVRTPFGDTARIKVTRGTPQGDALSPSLFNFFLNLCLRHLNDTGVGYTHACGVRRNNTTFADDICLLATSVEDMNRLLARVASFAEWAGMELCIPKCEVTAYNFRSKSELATHRIVYFDRPGATGKNLTRLAPEEAFKYLGIRL